MLARHVITAALCASAATNGLQAQTPPTLAARIETTLESRREALIALRRDLHRHPEIAGQESRTAGRVATRLEELGLEVRTGVGGHGIVAVLTGGKPGRVVGYRADMDAVASAAPDSVAFASETPGLRHICGHDIHVTVALGIAEALAPLRAELPGTLVFFFQPAEETGQGARAMIADGAMKEPTPEAIFAVHSAPLPIGSLAAGIGPTLPGRDLMRITLEGSGDLAAAASAARTLVSGLTTIDLAAAAAGITSSEDFVVAQLFASEPRGSKWILQGQITAANRETAAEAGRALRKSLGALDSATISHTLEIQERYLSGIDNDPLIVERMEALLTAHLGQGRFSTTTGLSPLFSEDFGFFQDLAPGVMFWLGVSNPEKGTVGLPHSPGFVADEESIFVGAKAMAAVLVDALSPTPETMAAPRNKTAQTTASQGRPTRRDRARP